MTTLALRIEDYAGMSFLNVRTDVQKTYKDMIEASKQRHQADVVDWRRKMKAYFRLSFVSV